jgi:hypothetical protein
MRLDTAVGPDGETTFDLTDPDRFDALSLQAPSGLALGPPLRSAPSAEGEREEILAPAQLIIDAAGRAGRGGPWVDDFRRMLERVAPYGWWDAASDEVRLHVERT